MCGCCYVSIVYLLFDITKSKTISTSAIEQINQLAGNTLFHLVGILMADFRSILFILKLLFLEKSSDSLLHSQTQYNCVKYVTLTT